MSATERRKGAVGFCECGCGKRTALASQTDTKRGYVEGQPVRYRQGHGGHEKLRKPVGDLYVVRDCGYETPCWVWQGGTTSNGYGRTRWLGVMRPATHVFLEMAGRGVPDGMEPDHLCHNPPCVNPDHLEVVTPAENRRRRRDLKLSVEAVAEIRAARDAALALDPLTASGKPRQRVRGGNALRAELAERYGIRADYIKAIWRGDAWAT